MSTIPLLHHILHETLLILEKRQIINIIQYLDLRSLPLILCCSFPSVLCLYMWIYIVMYALPYCVNVNIYYVCSALLCNYVHICYVHSALLCNYVNICYVHSALLCNYGNVCYVRSALLCNYGNIYMLLWTLCLTVWIYIMYTMSYGATSWTLYCSVHSVLNVMMMGGLITLS